jgi:hypothetical protein
MNDLTTGWLMAQKEYDQAATILQDYLQLKEVNIGDNHHGTLQTTLHVKLGKYEKCLQKRKVVLGRESPETKTIRVGKSNCCYG